MMNDQRNAVNPGVMTVKQLREELRSRGLKTAGLKSALIERLKPTLVEAQHEQVTEPINTRRRRYDFETDSEHSERTVSDGPHSSNLRDTDSLGWDGTQEKRPRFEESMNERERLLIERENALADRELAITQREVSFTLQHRGASTPNGISIRPFSLRDISDILPEFDSDSPASVDCTQFVDRVTRLFNAYGWDERMLVLAAQSKLRGNAKIWADTSDQLKLNFPNNQTEANAHIAMVNATRQPTESMSSYYHRMCAIARRGGVSEIASVQYIQNGLRHSGIQNATAGLRFQTCLELYTFMVRYEDSIPYRNEFIQNSVGRRSNTAPISGVRTPDMSTRQQIKCYNCPEYGHIAKNCPKPQKYIRCSKCDRVGHSDRECRTQARPESSSNFNARPLQDSNYLNPFQKNDTQKPKADTSTGNIRQICEDNQNVESTEATAEVGESSSHTGNIVKRILAGHLEVTAFIAPVQTSRSCVSQLPDR